MFKGLKRAWRIFEAYDAMQAIYALLSSVGAISSALVAAVFIIVGVATNLHPALTAALVLLAFWVAASASNAVSALVRRQSVRHRIAFRGLSFEPTLWRDPNTQQLQLRALRCGVHFKSVAGRPIAIEVSSFHFEIDNTVDSNARYLRTSDLLEPYSGYTFHSTTIDLARNSITCPLQETRRVEGIVEFTIRYGKQPNWLKFINTRRFRIVVNITDHGPESQPALSFTWLDDAAEGPRPLPRIGQLVV